MKVYLVTEPGGYDEGETPKGVYSTVELARAAAQSFNGDIYEIELDAVSEPRWVGEPEKRYWWDEAKS